MQALFCRDPADKAVFAVGDDNVAFVINGDARWAVETRCRQSAVAAAPAAALLPVIPAWPGTRLSAFHAGMGTTTAAALLAMLLVTVGFAHAVPLALCAVMASVGLFFYEQAYVRAGQLPPLS